MHLHLSISHNLLLVRFPIQLNRQAVKNNLGYLSMKIIVAIKQVPERDAQMRIDTSGTWIDEADLQWAMNEPDAYALEQALQLREAHGGEVIVLSAGSERVQTTLREALAKGADRAIHIDAHDLAQRDSLNAAQLLAAAIKPEQPDLVLTGLQSDDMGYGQTGVLIASLLGMPHASLILQVEKTEAGLHVKRELEEGWLQHLDLPVPALLTIQSGGSKLRYATLMGIKRAKTKELRIVPADDLGVPANQSVQLEGLATPQKNTAVQLLTGSAPEAAAALIGKLKFEARVL
jgi:electron transfer flavoprotein beta subunit